MNKYLLIRKIVQDVSLVVIMTVIIFVVFRLMPGNPAELFVKVSKSSAGQSQAYHRELVHLGLQDGKFSLVDFDTYLFQMFTFTWGRDYVHQGVLVSTEIAQALPFTFMLIGITGIASFALGVLAGISITRIRNTKREAGFLTVSLVVTSIPYYIIGIFLFLYFAYALQWFPIKAILPVTYITHPTLYSLGVVFYSMALPFFSLLFIEIGGHMITMRAAMVSTLGDDHILTAKAKGVPQKSITRKHAARVAIIPVTTRMALQLVFLMSGSLIVAIIFNWPGMGPLLYHAVLDEDYPLSEATTFIFALLAIVVYSSLDYIHSWLDPRISV